MSESMNDAIAKSKENYALLLSGIDKMNSTKSEASVNIDSAFNNVMGTTTNPGVFNFYYTIIDQLKGFVGGSILGGETDLKKYLLGTLQSNSLYKGGKAAGEDEAGVQESLFPNDSSVNGVYQETDFNANLESSFLLKHDLNLEGTSTLDLSYTTINGIKDAVKDGYTPDESTITYYSWSDDQKQSVQAALNNVLSLFDFDTTILQNLSSNTSSHLNQVLGNFNWEVPSLDNLLTEVNSFKASSVKGQIQTAYTTISNIEPYQLSTSYNGTLVGTLESALEYIDTLRTQSESISREISDCFEIAQSSGGVSGFRKIWVYWVLKIIDRPNSYRMDYNGAVQAISSLTEQKASARYAVSLVTPQLSTGEFEYLPTPVLNCMYLDSDAETDPTKQNLYHFIFTTLPCFQSLDFRIGSTTVSVPLESVISNSEFSYVIDDTVDSSTEISLRLRRTDGSTTEVSEFSNAISRANPIYEVV